VSAGPYTPLLHMLLDTCIAWLSSSGVQTSAEQLPQYGLQVRALKAAAEETLAAREAAAQSRSQANLHMLADRLCKLGHALTATPIRMACNNPSCSSVSGGTELSIVTGSGKRCSSCRAAYYCCRFCQAAHWPQHKPVCKAVAAAGAARSSSG
jgi:hypothetical protein